jgi:predicted SAM-dependent methyltransferase
MSRSKRKDKIFFKIDRQGAGIEIGPSHAPVAPKREGFNVHIIDHMNREQLIDKYENKMKTVSKVTTENIEEVDFIWHGEPYAELTGKRKHYDWIIASHVIEHTPDLIGFLNDCDTVLNNEGVISLVVPDSRYCFDYFRPITGIGKIIDASNAKQKIHSIGTAVEHSLNIVTKSNRITWGHNKQRGNYAFLHSFEEVKSAMHSAGSDTDYFDYHAWCFTPHSFRLMMHDLHSLGLIPFREVVFFPTAGCEFYITLGRTGKGPTLSRLEMLKQIKAELVVSTPFSELFRSKIIRLVHHIKAKMVVRSQTGR